MLNFFLLVLGVLSDATPGRIRGSLGVSQTLSKESFELNPRQRSFGYLIPTLMLMPTKVDPTTKNMIANGIWLELSSAGRMYQSNLHTSRWPAGSGQLV